MLTGNKPSEYGRIEITVTVPPVSLQAKSAKKKAFQNLVTSLVSRAKYLLSGDIKVSIEWHVHEKKRYETADSADIDNIIKPLLDALSGYDGIMVDDSQVQSISCHWVDSFEYNREKVVVEITYTPDEFISKDGLIFVEVLDNLYLPFWNNLTDSATKQILQGFENMMNCREQLLKSGIGYYDAKGVMSVQRVFHKARLGGFALTNIDKILSDQEKTAKT